MPKTDDMLAELAQKLGVAVEKLWAALVAQQRIEGTLLAVLSGVLLITAVILLVVALQSDDSDVTGWSFMGVVSSALVNIPITYWALTDLLNPAYAALYDLAHFTR